MDEPAVYVLHPDVMQVNNRKNYVRDRMRAALIYISEYEETRHMMTEGRYKNDDLLVRLRAVFGRVDQVRHHIDLALQQDDTHRRKRNMTFLVLPTHFPRPESMGQGDIAVWTNWIREETDEIMKHLEEEEDSISDPDDPFNGTANGVFHPLQDPLSLPPPVQMPKRGNNSKGSEHFQNLRENIDKQITASKVEKRNETVTPAQGDPREFREHSRESLDPMESIRNLHMQQKQLRSSTQELNQTTPSVHQTTRIQTNQEEANLITFSPVVEEQVPFVQGATGIQEQPKRERSPRKKKNSEWTLNQRQFDHSKAQEISHILPGEQLNVFHGEESVSYLQLPVKKKEDNRFCTRCGERGHGRRYCQVNTWCKFCITDTRATQACRRYKKFVKDNPIASSRRNTLVQAQGQVVTVNTRDLQSDGDTTDNIAQLDTAKGRARIQRTFSEIVTEPNEGGGDPDVKTTSSPKELSGRSHGPTLLGTSTVCRDKLSLTLSTKASRSKRNWPYHPTGCNTMSGAETYTSYRRTHRTNSSCECTTNNECTQLANQ